MQKKQLAGLESINITNYENLLDKLAELETTILDEFTHQTVLQIEASQAIVASAAAVLFREGRFSQASAHYLTIADAQPGNNEARFFHLY